jgi:Cytidine and deoxycytidylate deaminase zinc-binding region
MQTDVTETDLQYMRRCLELARDARTSGDHPVGALVIREGQILGSGTESTRRLLDVAAHAEVEALRSACRKLGTLDLRGATIHHGRAMLPVFILDPAAWYRSGCDRPGVPRSRRSFIALPNSL